MRYIKQIGTVLCLVALMGCATNRAVYNTLASVKAVTDQSVSAYFESVAKKQAPIGGVPAVARAYDNFQVIFTSAVTIASLNTETIAPPSVTSAATEVLNAITKAKEMK